MVGHLFIKCQFDWDTIDGDRFTDKSFASTLTSFGGLVTGAEMTATVTGALGIKTGSELLLLIVMPVLLGDYYGSVEDTTNLGTEDGIQVGDAVETNAAYTLKPSIANNRICNPIISNKRFAGLDIFHCL